MDDDNILVDTTETDMPAKSTKGEGVSFRTITYIDRRMGDLRGTSGRVSQRIKLINGDGSKRPTADVNAEITAVRAQNKRNNAMYKSELAAGGRNTQLPLAVPTYNVQRLGSPLRVFTDNIRRADTANGTTGNTTLLLGSSKAGKTVMLMHLYKGFYCSTRSGAKPAKKSADGKKKHNNRSNYVSFLYCHNPQIDLYKEAHKKCNLLMPSPDMLDSLVSIQHRINKGTGNRYQFLNMMDDLIRLGRNETMDDLILTLRNSNISSIISLQYSNLMSKMCRSNVNNVFLFRFNTDESMEIVIKCYLQSLLKKIIPNASMVDMMNWYREQTMNHGYIYVVPETGDLYVGRLELM